MPPSASLLPTTYGPSCPPVNELSSVMLRLLLVFASARGSRRTCARPAGESSSRGTSRTRWGGWATHRINDDSVIVQRDCKLQERPGREGNFFDRGFGRRPHRMQQLSTERTPGINLPILARRITFIAIGREGNTKDILTLVGAESFVKAAICRFPQSGGAIGSSRQNVSVSGRKDRGIQRGTVSAECAHRVARLQIPYHSGHVSAGRDNLGTRR